MLRAIQKGNAPSLIASLAVDAAAAFESAAGTASGVAATKADSKFKLYADYQAAVHRAYGQCFAGVVLNPFCSPNEPFLLTCIVMKKCAPRDIFVFKHVQGSVRGSACGGAVARKHSSKLSDRLFCEGRFAGKIESVMDKYDSSHAGVEQLKAQQAGAALRHLGDARDLVAAAQAASKAYDRADPVSSAVDHDYADLELKDAIEKPYARVNAFNFYAMHLCHDMRDMQSNLNEHMVL